jgi:hypothetical protein
MRVHKHSRFAASVSPTGRFVAALCAGVGIFLLIAHLAERQGLERLALEVALLLPAIFLSARSHLNRWR